MADMPILHDDQFFASAVRLWPPPFAEDGDESGLKTE